MDARLKFLKGPLAGKVVTLKEGKSLLVGRGRNVDIKVKDPSLSRKHCEILLEKGRIKVVDLESSNGTFVNGERVKEQLLYDGDRIDIGRSLIVIEPPSGLWERKECSHCGREISYATFADGYVLEEKQGVFLCPDCSAAKKGEDAGVVGGYRILEKVGHGAFGSVFKAEQTATGRVVALKLLGKRAISMEKEVKRFYREAKAVASLMHPNIIQIYDAGKHGDFLYIAMEYVAGGSLKQRIRQEKRLSVTAALDIAIQVVQALQHAYERNIVHRDIKPENILLSEEGKAKLVDFGLAKDFQEAGTSGLTAPGEGMGTLAYMPPEQIDNALMAEQRSDVYSLGATLYHMVTGKPPFRGKTTSEFIMKILKEKPYPANEINPAVPPLLVALIEKCMEKAPEDRFQTPDELLKHLQLCRESIVE
jgi:serine/threonine protein kinase